LGHVLAVAVILILADCFKPLHIDDPAYYYNAAHLAHHPFDPYGFDIFWYEYPESANAVLAPPVLLYWWSLAIRLFGENIFLWKLWLLPFSLLFAWSLADLFWRFAPGVEAPLLWLTVLSPTFFPNLNLMPDVPALALALGSVVVFLYAIDRGSYRLALAAGIIAAIGMQTKYTAFTAPVIMLAAASLDRRPGLGFVALSSAAAVFAAWELAVYLHEGASHFWFVLGLKDPIRRGSSPGLAIPLVTCIGGVAPLLALVVLIGLGGGWCTVIAGSIVVLAGYALIAWRDWQWTVLGMPWTILGVMGVLTWAAILVAAWRIVLEGSKTKADGQGRDQWFLIAWLLIELIAYFSISPFPAVRRIMGLVIILTLIVGRLAAQGRLTNNSCASMWFVAVLGVVLGGGFAALDWWEARVRQSAVAVAIARIHHYDPAPSRIWFTGHWGFQYYAEQTGMIPIIADGEALHAGDWLLLTLAGQDSQMIWFPPGTFDRYSEISPVDLVPLTTEHLYLGDAPIEHHEGPRVRFGIGRMNVNCAATSLLPPELLVRWAAERNRPLPPAAIPSVSRAILQLAESRKTAQSAIPWLKRLAESSDPQLRASAGAALSRIDN
jgi:hypothetical protein